MVAGWFRSVLPATLLVLLSWSGCAKTVVEPQFESIRHLDRPSRVLVYDFAVTKAQVKENQGLLQGTVNDFEGTTTYQHMGEIADEVRKVAAEEMVKDIQNLGLPAERAASYTPIPRGAVGITGQFLNVDEGNKAKRLVVGFGQGQSKVDIRIQLYGFGLNRTGEPETAATKLVELETHADSGAMPGAIVTGPVGAAAAGGVTAGVAAANIGMGAIKGYRSAMGAMTSRSTDQAAAYFSEYFSKNGWISSDKVSHADRR
jgi:hypothetical protein